MNQVLDLQYDRALIDDIAARFRLRPNNVDALDALVQTLSGAFDPAVPLVMDMATGSGKTYLMAALIDYLRTCGVGNVMVVTPSLIVQTKTVQNFSYGATKYIAGSDADTTVVTPYDYGDWTADGSASATGSVFHAGGALQLFVFNVQQLLAPKNPDAGTTGDTATARQTRIRRFMETSGNLFEYLRDTNDLVVIADEHHLYGQSAAAFRQAITDLRPAAVVGLTASASADDNVVFRYPLYRAIADGNVKRPVLAFRKGGYGPLGEEQQLRDALTLLHGKQAAYEAYVSSSPDRRSTNAVLFVVCSDVAHATETAELLRGPSMLDSPAAVLQVDNEHNDADTLKRLDNLDDPDSPVRAVVSVNKLKEGWDVRNIAVMVTLRAMTSDVLTQQTMGRGLRLPFGAVTGIPTIDQLDIVAHDSFHKLLSEENVLHSFGLDDAAGSASTPPRLIRSGGDAPTGGDNVQPPLEKADTDPDRTSNDAPQNGENEEWQIGEIKVSVIDADASIDDNTPAPIVVSVNESFAGTVVLFPRSTMSRDDSPFDLVDVTDSQIAAAAVGISDTAATMEREEIITASSRRRLRLDTRAVDQASVEALPVDTDELSAELTRLVLSSALIERTPSNVAQTARRIVPAFMSAAPVNSWTEETAQSAATALRKLISDAVTAHTKSLRTVVDVRPHLLPIANSYLLSDGEQIHERLSASGTTAKFVPRRHYGDWSKGMFKAAAFDSFSAEYRIAELLNKSGDIEWWMRLYDRDRAEIAFRINRTYRPDFVARDRDGVNWIIEGKAADKRGDEDVADKRLAAESLIRRLVSLDEFRGQRWGYLVAYDDTVGRANSWTQLRDASEPITQIDS